MKGGRLLRWAVILLIFLFLGRMVWQDWARIKEASFTLRLFPLLWATLIFAFSYFIQAGAWYLITIKLGIALSFPETLKNWFISQLGKYLPGKVWLLLGRFYLYESKGKSKRAISLALYFETVTLIAAGALIFLAALLSFKEREILPGGAARWLLLPFGFLIFFLHPRVLEKISNAILRLLKKEPFSLPISYPDVLWVLLLCLLAWGVGGVGFYFFVDAIYPVSPLHLLFLTGSLAISSTLGLVALFAPSGLGVREGALVYLLSYVMPPPVAVIISILTRLWMTFIEMGLIGVIYLFGKFQKRRGERNENV